MKQLQLIQVVPDDLVFQTEVTVQLLNFREMGYSDKASVLVFIPGADRIYKGIKPDWKKLEGLFPEVKFFYYHDTENVLQAINRIDYISLLRPWTLKQHFLKHPELKEDAIFYHDSDILFIKPLDFSPFIQDDINYISYTGNSAAEYNYICADHFDDKCKNALPGKEEEAKATLGQFLSYFNVTEKQFRKKKKSIGGAQYLLKNIDAEYWEKVFLACYRLKPYLASSNQNLMVGDTPQERENNGFQSWCLDMWAVLLTLWSQKAKTKCPPELDFLWATDPISKWDSYYIFHNAGTAPDLFSKRSLPYMNNERTYFQDDLSWVNKEFCSYNYVKQIEKTKQIFNL